MSDKWASIPDEMKALPQWIAWRMERRDGEMAKIPIDPSTGYPASVSNPATWTTFEKACRAGRSLSGIGFVFTKDDPFCGIDMDNHFDNDLIEWMDSYTERSQSGNGAHIIVKAEIADGRRTPDKKYEIYSSGRYFVMTGDVIKDRPVADAREKVANFYSFLFPLPTVERKAAKGKIDIKPEWIDHSPRPLDDSHDPVAFLSATVGFKFDALWEGDTSEYQGDDSRADAALLSYLRFATGGDRAQSEALFRSSGLMRAKFERKDYRDRTWAKIDNGDVYTPPEREEDKPAVDLSALVRVAERESSPWRSITEQQVRKALQGSPIGEMITVFEAVTDPPLPLAISLTKALCLAGCAMSGEAPGSEDAGDFAGRNLPASENMEIRGARRARLKIDTGGGQVANFYCICVAESATGKDAGDLIREVSINNRWHVAGAGSAEGFADLLMQKDKRAGLITISEMSTWLDKHNWQSKAAGFITEAFSSGSFHHALSRHKDKNGEVKERRSPYCFPSVLASVQPKTFQRLASVSDLETGFLSRFIVAEHNDEEWCGWVRPRLPVIDMISSLQASVNKLLAAHGSVDIRDGYQKMLCAPFIHGRAPHRPHWRRLASEYAPRIATALAVKGPGTPVVEDIHLHKAGFVIMWLYSHAERLFGNVRETAQESRSIELMRKIYVFIKNHDGCRRAHISRGVRGGASDMKVKATKELVEQGLVAIDKHGSHSVTSQSLNAEDIGL